MSEHYFVFGKNGLIERGMVPKDVLNIGKKHIQLDPVKMFPPRKQIGVYDADPAKDEGVREKFWNDLQSLYAEWGFFGKFGDIFMIEKVKMDYFVFNIIFIGWLEFPKPVLAVDILPFLAMPSGDIFFVGGIKKSKKTHQERKVLVGGIRDVDGFYFESEMEAAIREAGEEIGIKILPADPSQRKALRDLNIQECRVEIISYDPKVELKMQGSLIKIGSFWTSDNENHYLTKTKRVHLTTAFGLIIDLTAASSDMSLVEFKDFFRAGDDLSDMFFWDIETEVPDFGSEHHKEIYEKTIKELF